MHARVAAIRACSTGTVLLLRGRACRWGHDEELALVRPAHRPVSRTIRRARSAPTAVRAVFPGDAEGGGPLASGDQRSRHAPEHRRRIDDSEPDPRANVHVLMHLDESSYKEDLNLIKTGRWGHRLQRPDGRRSPDLVVPELRGRTIVVPGPRPHPRAVVRPGLPEGAELEASRPRPGSTRELHELQGSRRPDHAAAIHRQHQRSCGGRLRGHLAAAFQPTSRTSPTPPSRRSSDCERRRTRRSPTAISAWRSRPRSTT